MRARLLTRESIRARARIRDRAMRPRVTITSRCSSRMTTRRRVVLKKDMTMGVHSMWRGRPALTIIRGQTVLVASKCGRGNLRVSSHGNESSRERGVEGDGRREREDERRFLGRLGLSRRNYLIGDDCRACREWFRSLLIRLLVVLEGVCLDYIYPRLLYHKILFVLAIYKEREWSHCNN